MNEVVERILTGYDTITVAAGLLYVENRCLAIEQRRLGLDAPKAPRDQLAR